LLNEVLVVMITPFDLFGYGLYRYTFQMKCEEIPELKLDDGATRIFLNTRGGTSRVGTIRADRTFEVYAT
jgi:hypothetical protein